MNSFDYMMDSLRNNILYNHQWHLHGKNTTLALNSLCSVNANKFWDVNKNFGDDSIVIAVADDGCMIENFSNKFSDNIEGFAYIENGRLRITRDKNKRQNIFSNKFKHGTAICGLIAAPISNEFPVGVAPTIKIIPIRWPYDNGFIINQIGFRQFVLALSDKIDIFVNTWSKLPDFELNKESSEMISSFSSKGGRRGKGILFLWSAGNSNCPINYNGNREIVYSKDENDNFKSSSKFKNNLNSHDNVLVISSINSFFKKASYSCFGPGIDLCAPSNDVNIIEGKTIIMGLTTLSADLKMYTHNFKGTSGACAIAAGVAALNLSISMDLTANQLAYNLKRQASKDLHNGFSDYKCEIIDDDFKIKNSFIFECQKNHDELFEIFYGAGKIKAI
ncbi:S8 family serine peptidase [Dickeya dianthicola]|uniref:S8 family serine peptidase n=1 Tax=Dickeya dianthicola TaxID=204039 RepID=UPI001865BEFA|nr:S8 family serine peptidase [Dickeya dianthicola]QOL16081.1 S8 family serine peptidase [Dickeya dianthicola]